MEFRLTDQVCADLYDIDLISLKVFNFVHLTWHLCWLMTLNARLLLRIVHTICSTPVGFEVLTAVSVRRWLSLWALQPRKTAIFILGVFVSFHCVILNRGWWFGYETGCWCVMPPLLYLVSRKTFWRHICCKALRDVINPSLFHHVYAVLAFLLRFARFFA